jgi:hypothetical protein
MKLVRILLGMLLSQPVWAEWTQMGSPEGMTHHIDVGSIKKTENGRRAWVLYDFKSARQLPKGKSFSQMALGEFDCEGIRYRTLQWTDYAGRMGAGKVLGTGDYPDSWMVLAPMTVGIVQLVRICTSQLHD